MRWLSMAFKKTGQAERALSIWEEMLTWPYPEDVTPYIELAKYHEHRQKDFDKAMAYVEQALEQTPSHQLREIEILQRRRQRLEQKRAGSVTR
jgi:tetratricopeptide (TPR) repeat protein